MTDAAPFKHTIDGADLGGPGAPDAALCSACAMRVLGEAAGAEMRLSSISLDVTSHAIGATTVSIAVKVDKRARSLVFASCEARVDERLVFSAQALFSRVG